MHRDTGYIPGIKADSIRFASSRACAFSSIDRGTGGGLNCPPGHIESRSIPMEFMICISPRKLLTVSRTFLFDLLSWLEGSIRRSEKPFDCAS